MTVEKELEKIRERHGGVLRPADVVQYAANNRASVLHSKFEWDDERAGYEYRLWQAREIIRVVVRHEEKIEKPVRVYVSLREDRTEEGGGYRTLVDVMSNAALRQRLLEQAFDDFTRWQQKYRTLKELEPIFAAAKTARGK